MTTVYYTINLTDELSEESKARLQALKLLNDENIDYSDIPPIQFEKNYSKNCEWKCFDADNDRITVELKDNNSTLTFDNSFTACTIKINPNVVFMLKEIIQHLEKTNAHYQTCIG